MEATTLLGMPWSWASFNWGIAVAVVALLALDWWLGGDDDDDDFCKG